MKNRFGLHIGTENFSNSLGYPITIKYKNLNGAFDEYEFSLIHTDFKEPISKFQKVQLNRMSDSGVYLERFYGVLVADSVEKMGASKYYGHSISAMEYAWMLDNYMSPNISITKNTNPLDARDFYDPTILDVVNRVIKVNRLEHFDLIPFEIDTETQDILRAKMSPEWTFEGETLFSILNMLFNYCNINLKFTDFETLGNIQPFAAEQDFIETYTGEETTYDPTTMHTTLITEGKNIELTRPIIEPEFTYNPVKSPDGFEISPNNLLIETRFPISNVSGLVITPYLHATIVGKFMVGNQEWFRVIRGFIDEDFVANHVRNNDLVIGPDRKPYLGGDQIVMEKALYDTLDQTNTASGIGNRLYFETGKQNIHGLSVVAKMKSFWSEEENVSFRLSKRMLGSNKIGRGSLNEWPDNLASANNTKAFMNDANINNINNAIIDYLRDQFGDTTGTNYKVFSTFYLGSKPQTIGSTRTELMYDLQRFGAISLNSENSNLDMNLMLQYVQENEGQSKMLTRVKYTPIISDRIYTFRERNEGFDTIVSHQNYNQTTNNTSNESIGNLLDKVSKSHSGLEKTITMFHHDDKDILKIGSREKNYVITGGTLNYNIEHVDALYTFDQFYKRLNHYIGLREKWRQFEIPSEQVVRRQITLNSFAKFSTEQNPDYSTNFKNAESYLKNNRLDNLFINGRFGQHQLLITYAIPTASYFVNNSIVASGEMTTSQVLGTQSRLMEISGDQKRREQAVRMGLPANVRFSFGTGVDRTIGVPYNLPKLFEGTLTNDEFYAVSDFDLDSDLRERLAFSMRLHHVDTTGNIFINQHLSATNGLAGGIGLENADLKIIFLSTIPWEKDFVENNEVLQTNSAAMIVDNGSIKLPVVQYTKNQKALAVAVATENADKSGYDILYFSKEEVSNGESNIQYYINFSDRYLNQEQRREYEWHRLSEPVQIVDFEAKTFAELPKPHSDGLYGKVFNREWVKTNERHKANLGYIVPTYDEIPHTDDDDKKAITTGHRLVEISDAEFEENMYYDWARTNEETDNPTYITDNINSLPEPTFGQTALEERTNWSITNTSDRTEGRNYSRVEDLPLVREAGYKATITNFTPVEIDSSEYLEGSYLGWRLSADEGYYTYDVVDYADLPADPKTYETARVSNLKWNSDSNNSHTPQYQFVDYEELLPAVILNNQRYTVVNAELKVSDVHEWDRGFALDWTLSSIPSEINYYARTVDELPKTSIEGATAKTLNMTWIDNNWNMGLEPDQNFFFATENQLKNNYPIERYSDSDVGASVTNCELEKDNSWGPGQWDLNRIEGKEYKNIDLNGTLNEGYEKSNVWYYFYKQHNQLFFDLSRLSEEGYVIRVNTGFGYVWWKPTSINGRDPKFYDGIKNIRYYKNIKNTQEARVEVSVNMEGRPAFNDVWNALERQEPDVFFNLDDYIPRKLMIKYNDGVGPNYFTVSQRTPAKAKKVISSTNVKYYKGHLFVSGLKIELTADIAGELLDTDFWDAMDRQERQHFESLPQFYSEGGMIKFDFGIGAGTKYFKIQPIGADLKGLQNATSISYTKSYYIAEKRWSVPMIEVQGEEGFTERDVFWLIQEYEPQHFDDLSRFSAANGVIRMDTRTGDLEYKLVPVAGANYYNEYYEMATTIEEYYISKEKL